MSSNDSLKEPDGIDEEIVAYLDGELDAEAEARIVRQLGEDAAYRARLAQLQQAWDLLDNLRGSAADDEFVQSTVAMVAVQAEANAKTLHHRVVRRRSLGGLALVGLTLASLAAGYAAFHYKLTEPDRKLVMDLPVIERMDELRYIDNVEFLKQLERENLFVADVDEVEDEM
jgi:anti-sigma factor RsiW